jgi:drug/metabolite transporter (DMT)-like permease
MIQEKQSAYGRGIASLLLTVFGWGILYPASKDIVASGIDGFSVTAIRYGFGCLLVGILLLIREGVKSFSYEGHFLRLWFLGTVGFAGLNFFTFIGVTYSSAEHGTIILALLPMMGMVLSWRLEGQAPARSSVLCLIGAFSGVVIMITKLNREAFGQISLLGDAFLFAGTLSWAVYTVSIKRYAEWSALRATSLSSLPGTLSILTITAAANGVGIAHVPRLADVISVWHQFAILVVTTGVIVTWNAGIRALGVANGMLFVNLVPVVTFLIGYERGHQISLIEILGGLVTLAALVANNLLSRKVLR